MLSSQAKGLHVKYLPRLRSGFASKLWEKHEHAKEREEILLDQDDAHQKSYNELSQGLKNDPSLKTPIYKLLCRYRITEKQNIFWYLTNLTDK